MTRSSFHGVLGPGPNYCLVSWFRIHWSPNSGEQRYRTEEPEQVCQHQRLRDGIRTVYYIVHCLYRSFRSIHSPTVACISIEAVLLCRA